MWCVFPGWCLTETLLAITVSGQWPDMSSSYLNKIAAHNHPHPEWTPHRSCPSQRQETTANGQFFHRYVTFYCCFISLLSHIFFISAAAVNKVFVFVVFVVVINKSDSSAVPAMCSMCLPTHELIVPVWTYRTVTCEVAAACAYMSARCLFAVCTVWTYSHAVWCNWSEYTCCRNRHPCPSPIPLILHKTNHVLCVSIDVPLLHFA